jgi:hypothetical protein
MLKTENCENVRVIELNIGDIIKLSKRSPLLWNVVSNNDRVIVVESSNPSCSVFHAPKRRNFYKANQEHCSKMVTKVG